MIELLPVKTAKQREHFHLVNCIIESLKRNKVSLKDGDVLAISSKFVALSEGRFVKLSDVRPRKEAIKIAKKMKMSPELAELVLRESDAVFKGVYGFLLSVNDGMIAPNAGIDKSNIYPGHAILYPKNPFHSAEKIRKEIFEETRKKIGVVVTDSRLMPTRIGTTGIAIACAGLEPVQNCIGWKDLFGNKLKYTKRALADDLAAAAELLMGEAAEATPIVVVRANPSPWNYTDRKIKKEEMIINWQKDIYICGLRK